MGKRETYTQLLVREICGHLEWMATDPKRPAFECNALYRAAREVGRNMPAFVNRAIRQMEWHDAIEKASDAEKSHVSR